MGQLAAIVLFEIAAVLYLPFPPAESPIFLFPKLTRIEILMACAVGKGIAVFIVLTMGAGLRNLIAILLGKQRMIAVPAWGYRFTNAWREITTDWITKGGIWAFFACNAIPFMPMRTALAIAAVSHINRLLYTLTAMIAAVLRTYLFFVMFQTAKITHLFIYV